MRIEVAAHTLKSALSAVMPALYGKRNTTTPADVVLLADAQGLTVTAGQTDMVLSYTIPNHQARLHIMRAGQAALPCSTLNDIIRSLSEEIVNLEASQGNILVIRSGSAVYELCGSEAPISIKFPSNASPLATAHLPSSLLRRIVREVAWAASTSDARPVLSGVHCYMDSSHIHLTATDGVRFASSKTSRSLSSLLDHQTGIEVIIPKRHLASYAKLLTEECSTEIALYDSSMTLSSSGFVMQSSVIEGSFPSLDRVSSSCYGNELILSTQNFLAIVERVTLLAGDSHVIQLCTVQNGTLVLSARAATIGHVSEEVYPLTRIGEMNTISFNGRFMIDILRAIPSDSLRLMISGPRSPIRLQPIDRMDTFFLLTPVITR